MLVFCVRFYWFWWALYFIKWMFWISWENVLQDVNVSSRIHYCKEVLNQTVQHFGFSQQQTGRRITKRILQTLSTMCPMPGVCLVTMGPQTSQLVAGCTTFLCHRENVTVGLILLYILFVSIYRVFCVWNLWLGNPWRVPSFTIIPLFEIIYIN